MSNDPERSDASQISTDRESIRAWADEHEAVPFRDREEEAYRLADEAQAGDRHERADWEDFHSHLDEQEQVVIYHGETADEPFEVTHHDEAISRSNVDDADLRERLMEGGTVTSTVTETAVVEEVVVEEAPVESELVDTEVVDDSVVDVELVSRDVTSATLEETRTMADDDWFDRDRYLSTAGDPNDEQWGEGMAGNPMEAGDARDVSATSTEPSTTESITTDDRSDDVESGTPVTEPVDSGTGDEAARTDDEMARTGDETTRTGDDTTRTGETMGTDTTAATDRTYTDVDEEYPYDAHLEIEEAWSVTREISERHTIESRIGDLDIEEGGTVQDVDIDIDELQRNLLGSDMVDVDQSHDELREESAIETEFAEDDRLRTTFTHTRIVDDEVVDRQHVRAEITGAAERTDFERISSMEVASETTTDTTATGEGTMTGDGTAATDTRAGRNEEVMDDSAAMETASGSEVETGSGDIPLSQDEVGKDVVDASGETIGMVTDISEDGTTMFVDAHPGITEKIKAALDWGEADDDDYPVEVEQIDHVTRDAITLKGSEELDELDSPAM